MKETFVSVSKTIFIDSFKSPGTKMDNFISCTGG